MQTPLEVPRSFAMFPNRRMQFDWKHARGPHRGFSGFRSVNSASWGKGQAMAHPHAMA